MSEKKSSGTSKQKGLLPTALKKPPLPQASWKKPSPFLIPTIFESFSKYISYYQLMEYRVVCKEWNLMIIHNMDLFNGRLIIQIPHNTEVIKNQLIQQHPNRYKEIALIQNIYGIFPPSGLLKIFHHKKLAYVSTLTLHNYEIPTKILQKILCLLEPHLSVLRLYMFYSNNKKGYCNPFLMYTKDRCQSQPIRNAKSLQKRLRKFPNLKVLQFIGPDYTSVTSIDEISTVFSELTELSFNSSYNYCKNMANCPPVKFQQMPKLRRLSIKYACWTGSGESGQKGYSNLFSTLSLMKLKLRHLGLYEFNPSLTQVKKFISTQELTLETLILQLDSTYNMLKSETPFTIPELPTLKKLHISEQFIVKNLPFTLLPVPNLIKLGLVFKSYPNFKILLPRIEKETRECRTHLNIEEINVNMIDPAELGELSRWFPNVTKILLHNCDDLLLNRSIYTGCNRVKVLIIGNRSFFNSVTDSGILALPFEMILGMRKLTFDDDVSRNNDTITKRRLEEIKESHTYNVVARIRGKLTWLSLVFGIIEWLMVKDVASTDINSIENQKVVDEFAQRGFGHIPTDDDDDGQHCFTKI